MQDTDLEPLGPRTNSEWASSGINLRTLYIPLSDLETEHGAVVGRVSEVVARAARSLGSLLPRSRETNEQRNTLSLEEPSDSQLKLEKSVQAQRYKRHQFRQAKYQISPVVLIDYPQVMRWIQICESSHRICCTQNERTDSMHILAIDCVNMNVVSIWTGERYLALSYVWGGVDALQLICSNMNELCTTGSLNGRRQELSRTVYDAIQFVKGIGQRYLWVDRLCILQDEEVVKQNGIKHMDLVYKNSWAVIVAGAGVDTNSGLAGMHGRQRSDTYSQTYDKDVVSDETLIHTIYESRAWTLQERLLAPRRFVFLNDFLLFQCAEATFRDDVCCSQGRKPYDVRRMYLHEAGMPMELFPDPYMLFQHIIHSYTPRELTFDSDILNALTGIAHVLGQKMNTRLVYGLPENNLVESLSWYRRATQKNTSNRRIGFPSWSWCGWKVPASVPPLAVKTYRSWTSEAYPVISGESRLEMQTILIRMQVGEHCEGAFTSSSTIRYRNIHDWSPYARQCGRIQIDAETMPEEKSQPEDAMVAYFIVLQDASTPSIIYKEREVTAALAYNRCRDSDLPALSYSERRFYDRRPFLIVLMVLRQEREDGTVEWERAGIGHIYRRSILLCSDFSFEDNLILC